MSVEGTTVVVAMDSPAKTPLAALHVSRNVPRDTPDVEGIVWVSESTIFMFVHRTNRVSFLGEFPVRYSECNSFT